MSNAQNDDNDLVQLAKLIGKQFEDKFDVFIEASDEQNKTFQDNFDTILDQKLAPIQADVAELKSDMKIVRAAVTDTNNDLHKLEKQVARLEAA